MAYVRTLVGRHGLRAHRLECRSCHAVVYRFEQFCPTCGVSNVAFDPAVFKRFARCTIQNAAATCRRWPDHVIEAGDVVPLGRRGPQPISFCTICGAQLLTG